MPRREDTPSAPGRAEASGGSKGAGTVLGRAVAIGPLRLPALLGLPEKAGGLVIFAHGRGGGTDLAGDALARVAAPTLLIVGGRDREVIALNRRARELLAGKSELVIVPGAGHLFEEPGTLDEVVRHATAWFLAHLARPG